VTMGRPKKAEVLSDAERSRRYRERQFEKQEIIDLEIEREKRRKADEADQKRFQWQNVAPWVAPDGVRKDWLPLDVADRRDEINFLLRHDGYRWAPDRNGVRQTWRTVGFKPWRFYDPPKPLLAVAGDSPKTREERRRYNEKMSGAWKRKKKPGEVETADASDHEPEYARSHHRAKLAEEYAPGVRDVDGLSTLETRWSLDTLFKADNLHWRL
jgi:hypothetical protein